MTSGRDVGRVRRLNALIMEAPEKDVRVRYDVAAGLAQIRTVGTDGYPRWWTWELPRRLAKMADDDGLRLTADWLDKLADHQEESAKDYFATNGLVLDDGDNDN